MVSRRDWLVSKGLAKPGRGRLSREAHAAIEKAIADGMTFDDVAVVSTQSSNSDNAPEKKIVQRKAEDFFGDTPEPIWHHDNWHVFENGERKDITGIEVCRTCMVSLDWHHCTSPTFPAMNGDMLAVMR